MERFSLKPRLCFGAGALWALEELGEVPVFLVTDSFLAKSGLLEKVTARLKGKVTVFDRVTPDPSLELVARGVMALRESGAGAVVAFGGGSPMDCAKAIKYFAGSEAPLWCIPTTAGTGSEVTSFAVLTDTQQGAKYPLVEDSLLPHTAILTPEFLAGVPPHVTADTGMDVLSHAAEALVARGANSFTDALAQSAFVMAFTRLKAACGGDMAAREDLLMASCQAGIAFNAAGLGVCHSLAHAIGGAYHIPHGRINAVLLPNVIEWHGKHLPETAKVYAELAKACGLSPNLRALTGGLRRLGAAIGEPDRFEQKLDISSIAARALADRCTATDPSAVTETDLRNILEGLR